MPNERLRAALLENGLTPADLAGHLSVDHKTVERWVKGRLPYRRHRYAIATTLGVEEQYLWPGALSPDEITAASESEVVAIYPHRGDAPRDIWMRLFENATREIDILVYVGMFLAEDAKAQRILIDKAKSGVKIRLLLGDPDSSAVLERSHDEGIGDAIAAKVRNALALYQPLRSIQGVQLRLHGTVLYNSIYRAGARGTPGSAFRHLEPLADSRRSPCGGRNFRTATRLACMWSSTRLPCAGR